MVPNTHLADSAVTNLSARTYRRIYWNIGLEYSTTVTQLQKIRDDIEHYITSSQDFVPPEEIETFVRIDSFNASSIDMMLYCFTHTTNWGEWLKVKELLAYKVKEIVEQAEANFAFPSQSLYIESISSERPEVYMPPST